MHDRPGTGGSFRASGHAVGNNVVVSVVERSQVTGWETVARPSARELTLTPDPSGQPVVTRDARVGMADLWDLGPLHGASDGRALVIGDANPLIVKDIAIRASEAIPAITRFWGTDWSRRLVLVAPATAPEFADQAGIARSVAGTFVAATSSRWDPQFPPELRGFRSSRVVINPDAWVRLSPLGYAIVLRHEGTHVASQTAATSAPPTWFNEGVADEVGFLGTGLPEQVVVADAIDRVRRYGLPTALPGQLDFNGVDPGGTEAAYAESDVAVRLIVRRYGLAALRTLYRDTTIQARALPGPDAAFAFWLQADLHLTVARFTALWRADLRQLSDSPA